MSILDRFRKPKREMLCRLVLNEGAQKHCWECCRDAQNGWMPVSYMKLIGERACGNECACVIEFEDETSVPITNHDIAKAQALALSIGPEVYAAMERKR